jgi:hypothetical protein
MGTRGTGVPPPRFSARAGRHSAAERQGIADVDEHFIDPGTRQPDLARDALFKRASVRREPAIPFYYFVVFARARA